LSHQHNMKKEINARADYEVFGSKLRGTEEVEKKVKAVIVKKETAENLKTLGKALLVEWKATEENVSNFKLAFSKFEEKLDQNKAEISRCFAKEKEIENTKTQSARKIVVPENKSIS